MHVNNTHTRSPGPAFFRLFLEASYPYLPTFKAREITSLLNSFANLRYIPPHAYLTRLRDGMLVRLPEMQPWELATAMNGFGRFARPDCCCAAGVDGVEGLSAEEGYHPGEELLLAFEEASFATLEEFDPQSLSGLINGFAHLSHKPAPAFVRRFVECVSRRMPRFNTQPAFDAGQVALQLQHVDHVHLRGDQ